MDDITINVVIADRNYRITIKRADEELVRKTVEDINRRIKEFSDLYAYKDKQDLLAMVLLDVNTVLFEKTNSAEKEEANIKKKISELSNLIESSCLDK